MFTVSLRSKHRPDGTLSGYHAVWYDPSWPRERVWRSLRTRDEREAYRRLAELEREAALGLYDPQTGRHAGGSDVTLQTALDLYIKAGEVEWAENTVRIKRSRLGRFVEAFSPSTPARAVTADDVYGFLNGLKGRNSGKGAESRPLPPASQSTRHSYYAQLTGFYSWLVKAGHVPVSPMASVQVSEPGDAERPVLRPAEIERVKTAVRADLTGHRQHRGWLLDVIDFTAATGLRVAEVASLNWDAVEVESRDGHASGALYVANYGNRGGARSFKTKTSRSRRVPLFPRAAEVLLRLSSQRTGARREPVFRGAWGGAVSAQEIGERFPEYVEMARLAKPATTHSLRHTFITWCCNDLAIPVATVQQLAGHKSLTSTMKYLHVSPGAITSAIDRALGQVTGRPVPKDVASWMAGERAYAEYLASAENGQSGTPSLDVRGEYVENADSKVSDLAGYVDSGSAP